MEHIDPALDLVLERVVPVSVQAVWTAWTTPEHLMQWFTPAPWKTVACDIDLRPGGLFRTVMEGPDGERSDNVGCYLEVVPHQRLTFTDALGPDFRPQEKAFMTAVVTMAPDGSNTRYRAVARHRSAADRQAHEEMGFHQGWGAALDQLVGVAKRMA